MRAPKGNTYYLCEICDKPMVLKPNRKQVKGGWVCLCEHPDKVPKPPGPQGPKTRLRKLRCYSLSPHTEDLLQALSAKQKLSMSRVIDQAVQEYYDRVRGKGRVIGKKQASVDLPDWFAQEIEEVV